MKSLILISTLLLLAGCQTEEERDAEAQKQLRDVTLVRQIDGCNVYKFNERYTVYFSDCRGQTSYEQSGGKRAAQHRQTLNAGQDNQPKQEQKK
ncbi:hypothetical protein [Kingella oralis]|uniref:hypothetical protein n=1 Tax=Kingella oralis TaxID=505 RepID=UPI0034E4C046